MLFIIILTLIIYIVALLWTWRNLSEIDKKNKVTFIIITLIVNCLITFILFNISKTGISYENEQMVGDIRNILVLVFTGFNFLITAPYIARILSRINEGSLEKEQLIMEFNEFKKSIYNSNSWRITKPLRSIKQLINRKK